MIRTPVILFLHGHLTASYPVCKSDTYLTLSVPPVCSGACLKFFYACRSE